MGTSAVEIYLLLGSNLGDRQRLLREATRLVEERIGPVHARSSVYETEPWGMPGDVQPFLNQVLCAESTASPNAVMDLLLDIEKRLGRKMHTEKGYQSRLIDIDLLYFGRRIVNTQRLTVPHPRIAERRFVLVPMAEVAPEFVHPVLNQRQRELLAACPDPLEVRPYRA